MKKLLVLLILILSFQGASAQKVKEWLRQKKTQKQYLIEQIAHLELYLELAEKGYEIAKEGLTTIGQIKDGEFNLHKNRFDSLRIVKDEIKKLNVNERIIYNVRFTVIIYWVLPEFLMENTGLTSDEKKLIRSVFDRLVTDGVAVAQDLADLTKDGVFSMTDDARIKQIDALYSRSQQIYTFARQLTAQSAALSAQRKTENEDFENRRVWHGLN